MTTLSSIVLTVCLAWSLGACSSGPPKPVLPDGSHRVPVNRVPPVPSSVSLVQPASVGDGGES